jgi:hypothetical protein
MILMERNYAERDLHFEDIMAWATLLGYGNKNINGKCVYVDYSGPLIGPELDIKRVELVLV